MLPSVNQVFVSLTMDEQMFMNKISQQDQMSPLQMPLQVGIRVSGHVDNKLTSSGQE